MNFDKKRGRSPETLLDSACRSEKLKKLAALFVLAGIAICLVPLLPPVRRLLISFVDANTSDTGLKSSGTFESRLQSLLSLPFFGLLFFVFMFCCLCSKRLAAFFENPKNGALLRVLASGAAAALLVFIGVFSYRRGWQWINSDQSSEMMALGKLLAEENALVSRNWFYSTEIRLIYQTLFSMPLFKILGRFNDWALIRALCIVLNNSILILSYVFMAKQMRLPAKWIGVTSLFLIAPVSAVYWEIVIFGGFYVFFIAQLFCCLGLFIGLAKRQGPAKAALPGFIAFTALSFALGAQGIRSLICVHIPLLIACAGFYSKAGRQKRFPLFLGCYGFIVCCAGFALNFLLHFWYRFASYDNRRIAELFDALFLKIGQSLVCLPEFFGLSAGSRLLSAQGLLGVIAAAGTFFLFRAAAVLAKKAGPGQFLAAFFIVSVVFNVFVFVLIDEAVTDRYFIPFMVLYVPLMAALFARAEETCGHLKRAALVCGVALFVFGQGFLNFQSLAGQDFNSGRKGYIRYLLDNDLGYGFATYWNAAATTELSDGKIELAGITPDRLDSGKNNFYFHRWLSPVKFSDPSYYDGESFLLLSGAELEQARAAGRPFAQIPPDYNDGRFAVWRYPSAETIHRDVFDRR